jgi:ATP-binding cassette subfamily B (MDR/TAP) protein 1
LTYTFLPLLLFLLQLALTIVYIAGGVFVAGWIGKLIMKNESLLLVESKFPAALIFLSCLTEVSCWILTGERQTAVIRSKYVRVLLNQDMSFFDTYGNNGDIVSQVLSDVLLIQSALSEKVCFTLQIYCSLWLISQHMHLRQYVY